MSQGEWTAFCDRIDLALKPNEELRQRTRKQLMIVGAATLFLNIAAVVSFVWGMTYFIVVMILGTLPFVFFAVFLCKVQPQRKKIMDDIVNILNDESNQRSDVSFHFRIPGNAYAYIECSVGGVPETGGNVTGSTGTAGGDTNVNRMEQGLGSTKIEMPSHVPAESSAQPAPSAAPPTSIFSSLAGSYAGEGTTGSGVAS
jgi:hypothetical protein